VTNCRWQTVPHNWPGHRESSVAKPGDEESHNFTHTTTGEGYVNLVISA